jgi:hypothetical protein
MKLAARPFHPSSFILHPSLGFGLKVGAIALILLAGLVVASFPVKSYTQTPDTQPTVDEKLYFGSPESHPAGYRFEWTMPGSALVYTHVPRYTPLNLRLKLNLQRPAGAPPAHLEIYEAYFEAPVGPRLLGSFDYNPNDPSFNGPRDFYLTVPPADRDYGPLLIEFNTNFFQVANDRRELGVIFLEAEISVPRSQLRYLFWPHPYWIAGLVLLAAMAAWALRSGLSFFESLLLSGMAGLTLLAISQSTYQYSWVLLLLAALFWAMFRWEKTLQAQLGGWTAGPLMAATALLLLFFLLSGDEHGDVRAYGLWGASVEKNGIWGIYNYDAGLNYLPLLVYLLWFYNRVVYPFGWQYSTLSWRVFSAILYLALVFVLYLLLRKQSAISSQQSAVSNQLPAAEITTEEKSSHHPSSFILHPSSLLLVAFNAGIFFNPIIWGQSDMIALLPGAIAFYLIYRRWGIWGGLALGLVAISKPQAWFWLPVLAWLLVQRCGWKRGGIGLGLGGVLALVLTGGAFGMDFQAVVRYFTQPEFAGDFDNGRPSAFNLNYLFLGEREVTPPGWLSLGGFVVVALMFLGLLYFTRGRDRPLKQYSLAVGVAAQGCFTWLIKMKERYLIYGLPFLGLAAMLDRRLVKIFLGLSWLQLLQLIISLYRQGRAQRRHLEENFMLWGQLLNADWLRTVLSVCTVAVFVYLAFFIGREAVKRSKIENHTSVGL